MNGLLFLLDQAGMALQQANIRIAQLEAELAAAREQAQAERSAPPERSNGDAAAPVA